MITSIKNGIEWRLSAIKKISVLIKKLDLLIEYTDTIVHMMCGDMPAIRIP